MSTRKQRPELVQLEAQIAHSSRKRDNAKKIAEQVEQDAEKQRDKLNSLRRDLDDVTKAANTAQGGLSTLTTFLSCLIDCDLAQRLSGEQVEVICLLVKKA